MIRHILICIAVAASAATARAAPDEPIALETKTGTLHGSLRLPRSAGPHPVALLVAGSGPTDRDGNGPRLRNDALKQLAEALAAEGIATVRYDKRGVGESRAAGPLEKDLRFDHYIEDAAAWLVRLGDDKRFARVAVVGHSEGAAIAAFAAARAPVSAFVSLAGIASRASDVLRAQLRPKLPPPLYAKAETILAGLEKGETTEDVPPELAALFRPSVQPYLVSWIRHAPAEAYARLDRPILIVQGDADIQTAVPEAKALKAAAPKAVLEIVPRMSHVLKAVGDDPGSQMKGYTDPAVPIVPTLGPLIAGFLAKG